MKWAIASLTAAASLLGPQTVFGGEQAGKAENPQSDVVDAAATFERLDKDGDGQVTAGEVPESSRSFFDRLLRTSDADEDGALDREEFLGSVRPDDATIRKGDSPALPRGDSRPVRRNGNRLFRQLDRNGDDRVTLDEVPKPRRPMFERFLARADEDGDRILSRAEWERLTVQREAAQANPRWRNRPFGLFPLLDVDRDRKLSKEELARAPKLIETLDRDGDGALSIEELAAERPGNANRETPPTERPRPDLVEGVLNRYDTDEDGMISKDEAPQPIKRRFSRLDRDRNDLLDRDELARRLARRPGRANEKKPEDQAEAP